MPTLPTELRCSTTHRNGGRAEACAGRPTIFSKRLASRLPPKQPGSGFEWQTSGPMPRPQQRCKHERSNPHGRPGHLRPRSATLRPTPHRAAHLRRTGRAAAHRRSAGRRPEVRGRRCRRGPEPVPCALVQRRHAHRPGRSCRPTWCCPSPSPAWPRPSSWCWATASR